MARVVRCPADARDLDFLVADKFLSPDYCNWLSSIYRESTALYETNHRDPFWGNRLLGHRDVPKHWRRNTMYDAVARAGGEAQEFYGSAPLYADVLHIVGWPRGMHMAPHADNAHEDGELHEFHWRDYSGVLYLNDDFEGGELYLPKQDIVIKPRQGMFVSLPCGLSHVHGVKPVTSGLRITLAFFLTAAMERADRDLLAH